MYDRGWILWYRWNTGDLGDRLMGFFGSLESNNLVLEENEKN